MFAPRLLTLSSLHAGLPPVIDLGAAVQPVPPNVRVPQLSQPSATAGHSSMPMVNHEHVQVVAQEAATISNSLQKLHHYVQLIYSTSGAAASLEAQEAAQQAALLLQHRPMAECLDMQRAAYYAWQLRHMRVNASGM